MDTGATGSLVSHQLVPSPLKPCSLKARGIGGENLQVLGITESHVQLANITLKHHLVVVGMSNTCILFLKSWKAIVVDVAKAKLTWETGEMPLMVETTTPSINSLSTLLQEYCDAFVTGPNDPLGQTRQAEHVIGTGDSHPIKQRPYRIPAVHLYTVVSQQVHNML